MSKGLRVVYYNEGEYERFPTMDRGISAYDFPHGSYLVQYFHEIHVYYNMGTWSAINDCDIPPWLKMQILMET